MNDLRQICTTSRLLGIVNNRLQRQRFTRFPRYEGKIFKENRAWGKSGNILSQFLGRIGGGNKGQQCAFDFLVLQASTADVSYILR